MKVDRKKSIKGFRVVSHNRVLGYWILFLIVLLVGVVVSIRVLDDKQIVDVGEKNYCTEESRIGDACIAQYDPVCGWSDPEKVQCIRYPCASDYSNSCNACQDENVLYWIKGECPEE